MRLTALFLLISTILLGQYQHTQRISDIYKLKPREILKEAEKLYQLEAYQEAFPYFYVLSQVKNRLNKKQEYQLGKTALFAEEYDLAVTYLAKQKNRRVKFPLVSYEYGKALKHQGAYQEAITAFNNYLATQKNTADPVYLQASKLQIKACEKAIESLKIPASINIDDVPASDSQSRYIRAISTESKGGFRLVEWQEKGQGRCIKLMTPSMKIQDFNLSISNPAFNASCPHIAADGETVFFAQQEAVSQTQMEFKIYQARITASGELKDITKLGPSINRDGYSSFTPALGQTDKGQEVLYFSSTIPGGYGGYDIWFAVRMTNGKFTQAYNLGSRINTTADEITPFYHQSAGELFYSSNRSEGFGGYDVYQMTGEKKRWMEEQAVHLSFPINSASNDTHFTKDKKGRGFFSSDRNGKLESLIHRKQSIEIKP